jgi:hypothetical protein
MDHTQQTLIDSLENASPELLRSVLNDAIKDRAGRLHDDGFLKREIDEQLSGDEYLNALNQLLKSAEQTEPQPE